MGTRECVAFKDGEEMFRVNIGAVFLVLDMILSDWCIHCGAVAGHKVASNKIEREAKGDVLQYNSSIMI
jgi:hypothetical protein